MKYSIVLCLILLMLISPACKKSSAAPTQTTGGYQSVVEYYGRISKSGARLVDKRGNGIALHGMSLFWSQWGGKYFNADCVKWLRDDFKCTIIRVPCGVESGGYLTNPQAELNKITTVVDAAIKYGIYVIIDWHDHNAQNHLNEAKAFFSTLSAKYGAYDNVIYEIFNEPLQVSWTDVIKPYSAEIINTIRRNDPDNLIIAGSPNWSQDVDVAAQNPLTDTNLAYSLHYYSGTHKQWLRDKALNAINRGLALFVSEYGISEASGTGNLDYTEAERWFSFLSQYGISSCNWSVIDKAETSAALIPGAAATGTWPDSMLSASGKYIRNYLRAKNTPVFESIK